MAYSMAEGIASFGQSIGRGLEQRGKNKKRREFVLGRLGSINEEKEEDYMDAVAEYEASPQSDSDQATLQAKADELQKWHKLTDDSQSTGKLEGALAEFDAEEDRQTNDLRQNLLEMQIKSEKTRGEAAAYDLEQKEDPKSHYNKMNKMSEKLNRLNIKKAKRGLKDDEATAKRNMDASGLVSDFLSGTEEQVAATREVTDPAEFETRYNKAPIPEGENKPAFNLEDFGDKQDFKMEEGWSLPRMDVQGGATSGSIGGIYNTLAEGVDAVAEYGVRPLLDRLNLGDRQGRLDESYNWKVHEVTNEKLLPYLKDFKKETPGIEELPVYQDGKVARTVPLNEGNIPAENLSDFLDYANAKVSEKRAVANASARAKRGVVTKSDEGDPLPPALPGYEYSREVVQTKEESTRQESFYRDKTDTEIENELKKLMTSPEVSKLTLEEQAKFKENVEKMLYGNLRKHTFGDTELVESTKTGSVTVLKKSDEVDLEKQMQQAHALGMVPDEYLIKVGSTSIKFSPKSMGNDNVERTEAEQNSYIFSKRMIANEWRIEKIQNDPNFDASSFGMYIQQFKGDDGKDTSYKNYPKIAQTQNAKEYISAVDNWVEAALRKVSGAAINAQEYIKYRTMFFPIIDDSAETIEFKRRLRDITTRAFVDNAKIADINAYRQDTLDVVKGHKSAWGDKMEGGVPKYESEAEAKASGVKSGQKVLIRRGASYVPAVYNEGPESESDARVRSELQSAIEAGDQDELVRILQQVGG